MIISSEAAGRLLGLATVQPEAVGVLEDLIDASAGIQLVERPASAQEIGGPPQPRPGELPVAIVRDDARLPFADPAFQNLRANDIVVVLQAT